MFEYLKKIFKKNQPEVLTQKSPVPDDARVDEIQPDHYATDQPITVKSQDRFNRANFAIRISETVATRVDASSIVLGLYGPWGDGKTSVLEMMQEALSEQPNTIVVRFNPWHFQNEDLLLKAFFTTLADAMGRSLPNLKEKAGKLLNNYGSILSLASLSVAGFVQIAPGAVARGLGESLSNVGLDELRTRIEQMLDETKKRLVILVDDIDRLDRDETHAIFKLVKLSASFRHTSYILAFDDVVVASALGERYGAGGEAAGRAFLEKIIQVPLHLPPVDQNSLRQLALEGVQKAINQAAIEFTQQQVDFFIRSFDDALLPRIETPRRAKLLANAISFALPILKGEVNPADLMLIEGIRVMYPMLYTSIRDNSRVFLKGVRQELQWGQQDRVGVIDRLIEDATPELKSDEREVVKSRLLQPLFPRISGTIYDHEWDRTWGAEQKVCSADYFRRYFTYSVPVGDVPDAEVMLFCENSPTATEAENRQTMESFAQRQALSRVMTRIRQQEDSLTTEQAIGLLAAFSLNGDLFPRERGMMVLVDTRAKAAMLCAALLRRIVDRARRQELAVQTIQNAVPLGLALECFRWIRHDDKTEANRVVLTSDGLKVLRQELAARISAADAASPLFLSFSKDAPMLYWSWIEGASEEEVRNSLNAQIQAEPQHMDVFLACYVGEAWEIESGMPRPADFSRENFNSITTLLPMEFIANNLTGRYGEELNNPQEYPAESMPQARRVAHQFMLIYQHVQQETTSLEPPTT